MDIIEVLKNYARTRENVSEALIDFGVSTKFLTKLELNDVDDEVVTKLLLHWIVVKGIKRQKYKIYFKDWE